MDQSKSSRVCPAADSPVSVILDAEACQRSTAAHMVDISETGIGVLISSETELRPGSVELSISLPGHLDALSVRGVIRNGDTVRGQIHYGIEFEFEQSEESQRIRDAITGYVTERLRN